LQLLVPMVFGVMMGTVAIVVACTLSMSADPRPGSPTS
jgi:hypothetical protein